MQIFSIVDLLFAYSNNLNLLVLPVFEYEISIPERSSILKKKKKNSYSMKFISLIVLFKSDYYYESMAYFSRNM